MSSITWKSTALRFGTLAILGGTLTACAHIKPDQLESRLDDLRAEMRGEMADGDQKIAGELDNLDGVSSETIEKMKETLAEALNTIQA